MYWVALAASAVIAVGYLAISATIVRRVLLHEDQWRTNPLAVATAAIFFSCGIGHGLHGVHLVEYGAQARALYDWHVTSWDVWTAVVAVWYWSIRGRLDALRGSGALFEDARLEEQRRLASLLGALFDGVTVVPVPADGAGFVSAVAANPDLADLLPPPSDHAARAARVGRLAAMCAAAAEGGSPREELRGTGPVWEVQCRAWDEDSVVLAWRDVTSTVAAVEASRRSQAELAAAFDAAPVAMALITNDRVERGNGALQRMVSGVADPGAPWTDLFAPDDRTEAEARLAATLQGQPVSAWDVRVRSAGADDRWAQLSLAPVERSGPGPAQVVAHLVDIEDRKRYESRLRHVAEHDPLTGLANRRRFERELRRQCDIVARYGGAGALMMIDLDHFKDVNDTFGHGVGDQLLVSVAQVLRAQMRDSDVVARLGGDEFAVIQPHADREEARELAARLCEVIRLHTRSLSRSFDVAQRVTASIGVALFDGPEVTPEGMMISADLTLYDAKEAGRNTFAFYSDGEHSQPRTKSRLEWMERLRTALDSDSLAVVEQPMRNLRTGEVDAVELLLRLTDPDGVLVAPARFLYMAEQSDLICEVDRWMLGFATSLLASRPSTAVCVNISGRSLSDPTVLAELEAVVAAAALPAGGLVIEVTETAAVANLHDAREGLLRLQRAGCRVALDDFGAGFGSLAYVKHLPFDILKIDGQFVEGCLDNPVDLTVIDAVVSLAQGLGKEVVAEHVPDEATLDLLRRHGVGHAQGYHVGIPTRVALPTLPRQRAPRETVVLRP